MATGNSCLDDAHGALPWGGRLSVSWSPGASAFEKKMVGVTGDGMSPAIWEAYGASVSGAEAARNYLRLLLERYDRT